MLLWTRENHFKENRIWSSTSDLDSFQTGPVSFLMAVMVSIDESFDPTGPGFKNLLNLSNRIQGYMSRTVPGKMWVRISHNLMKRNFSLHSLGQCIAYSFIESIPAIKGMEIILAADNDKLIEKFDDIKNRAEIISGTNRKLALEKDGTISCEDLDCRSCEYKTECDTIRDIISKRKEL